MRGTQVNLDRFDVASKTIGSLLRDPIKPLKQILNRNNEVNQIMTTLTPMSNQADNLAQLPVLTVNDQPIPWKQAFGSMQLFGKFQPFLRELVTQSILLQEINSREDLEVNSSDLIQAVMKFQAKHGLTDQEQFKQWLTSQGLDSSTFQKRIVLGLKLKQLRRQIAAPSLQSYFETHQASFEQLQLSCLFTSEESLAMQLKQRVAADNINLAQLANEYANSDNAPPIRFLKQQVQRRSLSTQVGQALTADASGEIVGPINVKEGWGLFRIDESMPAELNDQLTRQLETQLFAQWLFKKMRDLKINFDAPQEIACE